MSPQPPTLLTAVSRLSTPTLLGLTNNQSQSYVTTNGQSASLSCCQAPIWNPRPYFRYCQTLMGFLMWGVLTDKRIGLSYTIAAGPHQHCHSRVRVPGDSLPYFTISDSRLSQPGGPGPILFIPQGQDGLVIPQELGSIIVVSYDSQG
jgi:hypothetical protein